MAGTTGGDPAVRPAAVELAAARLRPDDRAVLLGAGGWFGATALHLLAGTLGPERLLPTTGRPRTVRAGNREWALSSFDLERIRDFRPTVVLDLAFLTREKVESVGLGSIRPRELAADLAVPSHRVTPERAGRRHRLQRRRPWPRRVQRLGPGTQPVRVPEARRGDDGGRGRT